MLELELEVKGKEKHRGHHRGIGASGLCSVGTSSGDLVLTPPRPVVPSFHPPVS
jgi:hypothetical protein